MKKDLSTLKDEELMELYKHGEIIVFDALFKRHRGKLYGFLRNRINHRSDIDEIFQYVKEKVAIETNGLQVPQKRGNSEDGEESHR